jgi:uncharacterized protein (DUF2384 family)
MDAAVDQHYLLDVASGNARESSEALTLDTLRAARNLSLDAGILQAILATDATVVARLLDHRQVLTPDSDAGVRALSLVRLHRALGDVFGSVEQVNVWLDRIEPELGARPRDLIGTPTGLERVVRHMEGQCRDIL